MKQNSILLLGWQSGVRELMEVVGGGGGMVVCVVQVVSITGGKSHLARLTHDDRYETVTVIILCMAIAIGLHKSYNKKHCYVTSYFLVAFNVWQVEIIQQSKICVHKVHLVKICGLCE